MSFLRSLPKHPLKTPPLSGPQVGWFRPAATVVTALLLPAVFALASIYNGGPVFAGPPKDGTGYSLTEHTAIVLAVLGFSFLTSWMASPLVLLALRAAAMLGYAGWGTAILTAWLIGLPIVHVFLNGDLTAEEHAILPHMLVAIGILGLSVWFVFWVMMHFTNKKTSP